MRSPFNDMYTPFKCFFDASITITSKSSATPMTLDVSVFQDVNDDPLSENSLDSDVPSLSFITHTVIPGIQRGDVLAYKGKDYTIQRVDLDENIGNIIKARLK